MNSVGEDLVVKMRKPYTITKQREKWTEEEHNRFLEALKLYGRAWLRIEEHIGTKTAIQIRSHAQKFFTKLEKEAVAAGNPLGQAHDIDIPPPRPKKKPNYPYPRKASIPPATETADEKTLKAMNPLPQASIKQEASVATKLLKETKKCSDEGNCSLVLNLFQDAPSSSILSGDKGSKNRLGFREYVPMCAQPKEPPSLRASSLTIEVNMDSTFNGMTKSNQALGRTSGINIELHASSEIDYEGNKAEGMQPTCIDGGKLKATVENGGSPSGASSLTNQSIPSDPAFHNCSAMSYISPFPTFPSYAQLRTTQDLHRSFLGISSTFSSQIISTLLQNPAVHAAACMAAASLYPSEEMDSSDTTAIAAATVAAASAWWGTNGLIPFLPPIHAPGFAFSPPAISIPVVNAGHAPPEKVEERHEAYQDSLNADQQALLPSSSSSSNLEIKKNNFSNIKPSSDVAHHNLDRAKMSKYERSSCGSNTSSSSEIETYAMLKKNDESKDGIKQSHFQNLPAGEVNTLRGRTGLCSNETWKEVSQEGRLAFQALFSRDILPQSFATQFDKAAMVLPEEDIAAAATGREEGSTTQNCSVSNETGVGSLKPRPTGFKPYKRCSAEAEVRKSSANDESSKYKKIRLQVGVSS